MKDCHGNVRFANWDIVGEYWSDNSGPLSQASEIVLVADFLEIKWQSEWYEKAIQLRDDILRRPLGLSFTPSDIAAEADQWHFGLVQDDQLIAIVVVVPLSPMRAKLRQMAVTPSLQRQGHGAVLVARVEDVLRERGFEEIELNAREVAMGFYNKLGYQPVGEQFIEVSIPHYKMVKTLSSPTPSE